MKSMMNWNSDWVALEVKEYEIAFQEAIEQCVVDNGLPKEMWWRIVGDEEQIFLKILEILSDENNDNPFDILISLQNYYIRLAILTDRYIQRNKAIAKR